MSTQFYLQSAVNFPVALWIESPQWPFAYQGCTAGTFKIYMYSEDNLDHRIDLYAQGSKSIPYQVPQNKWSHLNPQWRFTDTDNNVINSITLTNAVTTMFEGTTGYLASGEFYYIDDMPSYQCDTIFIWAVADFSQYPVQYDNNDLPGFANSKVFAVAPYLINELIPTSFQITRDGLNPLFNFYWKNATIPHVVSVIGTAPTYPEGYTRVDACTAVLKHIPTTNILGLSGGSIIRSLDGVDSTAITWTPDLSSTYLSAYDLQNFRVGGYIKGKVVVDDTIDTTTIDASGTIYYEHITTHYPYLWISNPVNNTFNRIFAPCMSDSWMTPDAAPFLIELGQTIKDVSVLQVSAMTDAMTLTGFHGIYGIAIDASKHVWCTDIESDKIYRFDPNGILLSSIELEPGVTPAGISLDSISAAWVTLFDAASVLKIDINTGETILTLNPSDIDDVDYIDPVFKPVLAETDINDNVWITFQNPICCALIKYSSEGTRLSTITLPLCSDPMDIYITSDNDIWVSLAAHAGPPYGPSSVRKYNGTTLALISSISALNPAYIAMDNNDSLWFTQDVNTLTRVTSSGTVSSWTIGEAISGLSSPPPSGITLNSLEGLCCDTYGRVWVINSSDNNLYTIFQDQIHLGVKLFPNNKYVWYNDTGAIVRVVDQTSKSAQAFGDWSGSRWIRKYDSINVTQLSATLSGSSNDFSIYDYTGFDIRRFNESWDASNEIKKYARSPHIADNPVFWNSYMKALWGDESTQQGSSFGREIYEKIANFVPNHHDINVCNVDQLYNLAQVTDVPIDDYGIQLPTDMKRLLDIGSVNQQYLWGSRCKCNRNITNTYSTYISAQQLFETEILCKVCGHKHPGNRGDIFSPLEYTVSAYIPFIVEDRTNTNNRYQLINSSETALLSSCYNTLLPSVMNYSVTATYNEFQEAITHFCFYNYIPSYCTEQVAGVINWDDPYTTLNENASSINDWYGEGQALEKMINYVLHKGLGLIEE
jgi:streptogramin lyase